MGIEITSGGVSKTFRYYPYDAFYVDANGNLNTSGNGQQVREAYFNGTKYYPEGMKPPTRIEIIRKPTLSDYSDIVVRAYTADNEIWYNESYPNGLIPFNELRISKETAREGIALLAKNYFPNGVEFSRASSKVAVSRTNRTAVGYRTRNYDVEEVNSGNDFRIYCCGLYDTNPNLNHRILYIVPVMVVNKNSYPFGSTLPSGTRAVATSLSAVFTDAVPTQYDAAITEENSANYYDADTWYRVALDHTNFFGSRLNDGYMAIEDIYNMADSITNDEFNTFTASNRFDSGESISIENLLIHCVEGVRNIFVNSYIDSSNYYRSVQALIGMIPDLIVHWTVPSIGRTLTDRCCLEIDTPFPLAW